MVVEHFNRKVRLLLFILMTCCLIAGAVDAAVNFDQLFSGMTGSACNPCDAGNQSACGACGTCGERVTTISLGMTGVRFSGTPTTGPAPLQVQFSAHSGPDIATWSWDFGDGSFGSGMNPVHIYSGPGTYTVKLTVRKEQTRVNYETSSSFSWGEENTWQKEAMIHVTGPVGPGILGSSDQKGVLTQAIPPVEVSGGQTRLFTRYSSGMFQPLNLRQDPPLDFTRVKTYQRGSGMTAWKTGIAG